MTGDKKGIRPTIPGISTRTYTSEGEAFQNCILRPILKMQHDLLITRFTTYLNTNKIDFTGHDETEKRTAISKILKKDSRFKTELCGMIIGHFTVEEYKTYERMAVDMNKRIIAMLTERIQSVPL